MRLLHSRLQEDIHLENLMEQHQSLTKDLNQKGLESKISQLDGTVTTKSGLGADTISSGIEGAWTSNPIKWDMGYFDNLFGYEWELTKVQQELINGNR